MSVSLARPAAPLSPVPNLSHVLSLLRKGFVRDFLLYADEVADAAVITSPLQQQYAFATDISEGGYEIDAEHAGAFDFNTATSWLVMPAFSVGNISLGAVVENVSFSTNSEMFGSAPRTNYLYCARDDSNGDLLCVSEMIEGGLTKVSFISFADSVTITNIILLFNTAMFRRALEGDTSTLKIAALQRALTMSYETVKKRFCPICCASPACGCGCRLRLVQCKHPLDFQAFLSNGGLYMGNFTSATGRVTMYHNDEALTSGQMITTLSVEPCKTSGLKAKLTHWAAQSRLSKLRVNPSRLVLPATATDQNLLSVDDLLLDQPAATGSQGTQFNSQPEDKEKPGIDSFLDIELGQLSNEPEACSSHGSEDDLGQTADAERDEPDPCERVNEAAPLLSTSTPAQTALQSALQEKIERRKERNRRAARKSNLKRKLQMDTLKTNLDEAKKRVEELRAKELNLRKENLRLRRTIRGEDIVT